MIIETKDESGHAFWSQVITCKKGEYFRIDADVTAELVGADDRCGFVVAIQPNDAPGDRATLMTPGVQRTAAVHTVRAYYQAPADTRRLQVRVGVVKARGRVTIHAVRVLSMIEPEELSHPLAIPPPGWTLPAPKIAKRVCVCSESADERPITRLLGEALGESNVRTASPKEFGKIRKRSEAVSLDTRWADAIFFPDETQPPSIRTLAALMKLAERVTVVISVPAFAKLSRGALSIKRVEQEDDPICAQIAYADWMTRGFALQDPFTYAWSEDGSTGYIQRHFRKTTTAAAFLKRHEFVPLLHSATNRESSSYRPVGLFKKTAGGGLFVLDIEPMEASVSSMNESVPPMQLLLAILGHGATGLGQFTVAVLKEPQMREVIREAGYRFREFAVFDDDLPADEITHQLVTIGRADESYGLPLTPKPLILVRGGLQSGDAESVMGALFWFKQLIRMAPHESPYAAALASRFRLAWVPCAAKWERRDGWRRGGHAPAVPMSLDLDDAPLAAVIDIISRPVNRARVVLAGGDGIGRRIMNWLPRLWEAFGATCFFGRDVGPGEPMSRRDCIRWAWHRTELEVDVDPQAFDEDFHREALSGDAQLVRIEVPAHDADFPAASIRVTDTVATLLEQVIGLQYGVIAVNRRSQPVHFDGFAPVAPGGAIVVHESDSMLKSKGARAV